MVNADQLAWFRGKRGCLFKGDAVCGKLAMEVGTSAAWPRTWTLKRMEAKTQDWEAGGKEHHIHGGTAAEEGGAGDPQGGSLASFVENQICVSKHLHPS